MAAPAPSPDTRAHALSPPRPRPSPAGAAGSGPAAAQSRAQALGGWGRGGAGACTTPRGGWGRLGSPGCGSRNVECRDTGGLARPRRRRRRERTVWRREDPGAGWELRHRRAAAPGSSRLLVRTDREAGLPPGPRRHHLTGAFAKGTQKLTA